MNDLIKEIEVKKINIGGYHNEKYADGFIDGVNEALEVINQYNLITAPKSIKLSEILGKLNEAFEGECYIKRIFKSPIYIVLQDDIVVSISKDLKQIMSIEFNNTFIELKWLYTLWLAGTEIIDDLEVE